MDFNPCTTFTDHNAPTQQIERIDDDDDDDATADVRFKAVQAAGRNYCSS